jgi:hypothetical protein
VASEFSHSSPALNSAEHDSIVETQNQLVIDMPSYCGSAITLTSDALPTSVTLNASGTLCRGNTLEGRVAEIVASTDIKMNNQFILSHPCIMAIVGSGKRLSRGYLSI